MDNQKIILIGIIVVVILIFVVLMKEHNTESFDREAARARGDALRARITAMRARHSARMEDMRERRSTRSDARRLRRLAQAESRRARRVRRQARLEEQRVERKSRGSSNPRRVRLFNINPSRRNRNAVQVPIKGDGWVYMNNEPQPNEGGECSSVDCPENFDDYVDCWKCQ